jgi:hypothetical protein
MKKWVLRVYLVIVHLLLLASLGTIGWYRSVVTHLPLRVEWHWGATYKDEPMAAPGIEDSDYAIARIGDEKIAAFCFEKGVLDSVIVRWPGDPKEFHLRDGGR